MKRWLLMMLAAAVAGLPGLAQEDKKTDKPAENKRYTFKKEHDPDGLGKFYMGREIAKVLGSKAAGWLERKEREKDEKPGQLIEALDIKEGMKIADIGAGTGYFTFRLAKLVGPKGKVYAVDIDQDLLDGLQKKVDASNLKNVEVIKGTETNPKLPPADLDMILLVDVYHEFADPFEMMKRLCSALKPGGKLVLVEYRQEDPKVPIKTIHKMSQDQVKKEMEEFPLRHDETKDVLPWQHIIIFERNPNS